MQGVLQHSRLVNMPHHEASNILWGAGKEKNDSVLVCPFIRVNIVVLSGFIVIQFIKTPPRNGFASMKRSLFINKRVNVQYPVNV